MAEHDREEGREPDDRAAAEQAAAGEAVPLDETAAWEAIVAGYGDEPVDPPGAKPFKSVEDLALLEAEPNRTDDGPSAAPQSDEDPTGKDAADEPSKPLGSSVAFAPGVAGPRDYSPQEASEEDFDGDDEGHFVPPEPPPLPASDATAKFGWLGVLGGPLLLLLAVLFGWQMTWWLTLLGVGGFLGGFATLVGRMRGDEEEDDDPGRGAVV
ncbi:hypothetical protein ACFV0R_14510 [Streptomyces sp. NPDC059578]|uniref:hypothetical protein n=1 Tax=Streptomyces sp. NPDC059578 TaxID=3346874 RepID=UPI0036B4D151